MSVTVALPAAWREYLLNLTTQRAVKLFAVSLALGSLSILLNIGLPWVPAAFVLVYGATLLYSSIKFLVPHSESTNNSPYFLGFLFFLLSLFRTFYWSSSQSADNIDAVIRQLGAALLTTIVGLPLRQALFAYSPTQADEDLFFRTLEEELRRNATEFRKSQTELVQLVQEFVEAKRSLFAEESMAVRHYIRTLTKATAMFDGSINTFPEAIIRTLDSCKSKFEALDAQLQRFSLVVSGIDGGALQSSVGVFEMIGQVAKRLESSMSTLELSLGNANKSAAVLPEEFSKQLETFSRELGMVGTLANAKIRMLEQDLQGIDRVLTGFINLLEVKVASYK